MGITPLYIHIMKGRDMKNLSLQTLLGAAFLMATSAIGPGFLTQTTTFTAQHLGMMFFIILCVIALDICTQLNIWSMCGATGLRGQDIANKIIPGLGYVVAFIIALGGFAFNIGNVAGAALGLHVLFDLPLAIGVLISGLFAILIFIAKSAQSLVDILVRWLGIIMIATVLFVVFKSKPSLMPIVSSLSNFNMNAAVIFAILTLLGGSCGGYITFAGIHRLIDAKITGINNLSQIRKSLFIGVGVSGFMRILLFLAVFGVILHGGSIDSNDPAASAFKQGAGIIGYKIFGLVIFFASITSVIGAAYTSVSFLKTLSRFINNHEQKVIVFFIAISTCIMVFLGKPSSILVAAGALNGLILPLMLLIILIASFMPNIVGDYNHPYSFRILGFCIMLCMGYFGFQSLPQITSLLKGIL